MSTWSRSRSPSGSGLRSQPTAGFMSTPSSAGRMIKEEMGSFSLILERPFSPYPLNQILHLSELDLLYNKGRIPFATWNSSMLASNLRSPEGSGSSGFALFSPKFLSPSGWKSLSGDGEETSSQIVSKNVSAPISPIMSIFSEDESGEEEWAYGSFPLEEYVKALDRSEGELCYNHSLGMRYSKITEQIHVGSCIQTESDLDALWNVVFSST